MLRALVVAVCTLGSLAAGARAAHADTIALLPLDADKRLEIYGQPVAAEVGRALKAGGIDVVIVGAKMAVPDKAQLIVDGSIKAGKGDAITLTMRIRDPRDGTTLETLPATAVTLTTIDKAAADLSAKIVPSVKSHLATLAKAAAVVTPPATADRPAEPTVAPRPVAPALPEVLVSAIAVQTGNPALELLAAAMTHELTGWARSHRHSARLVDASKLARATAPSSVGEVRAPLGVALEILSFTVDPGAVPMARARVRLRIADATQVTFERVIRTDTIVGDRDITEQGLAARTAREVLAIANAQLRRRVTGWR
jgi:hypothetical protein